MSRQWIRVEIENGGTEFEEVAEMRVPADGERVLWNNRVEEARRLGNHYICLTPRKPAALKLAEAVLERGCDDWDECRRLAEQVKAEHKEQSK